MQSTNTVMQSEYYFGFWPCIKYISDSYKDAVKYRQRGQTRSNVEDSTDEETQDTDDLERKRKQSSDATGKQNKKTKLDGNEAL